MNADDYDNLVECIGTGNEAVDQLETLSIDLPYHQEIRITLEKIISDTHKLMTMLESEELRLRPINQDDTR